LAQLDEKLAADMLPQNALRRALGDMKDGRVIRQLRREGDSIYFQFTAEHLGKYEAKYDKEAELVLNVVTTTVECHDTDGQPVPELRYEAIRLLVEHTNKRRTNDLTRMVQRVFDRYKADLIPIRPQGGVYFVPDMHSLLVEKADQFLKHIGGELSSYSVQLGVGKTSESVAKRLGEYLNGLVTELLDDVETVTKETRSDVVARKQSRIAENKRRLSCYKHLMGSLADGIGEKLDMVDKKLTEYVLRDTLPAELPPAEPAAKPASLLEEFQRRTAEERGGIPMDSPLAGVGA
jgi:hypothetical protein